jgi:hypothetical protein
LLGQVALAAHHQQMVAHRHLLLAAWLRKPMAVALQIALRAAVVEQ